MLTCLHRNPIKPSVYTSSRQVNRLFHQVHRCRLSASLFCHQSSFYRSSNSFSSVQYCSTFSGATLQLQRAMADGKWRGDVTDVIAAPIDKVWPLLAEFGEFHKHFPQIFSYCKTVEGESNKVGSLRSIGMPLPDGKGIIEADERLISLDDVNHTTSYTIEKINLDWTGYKATIAATSPKDNQTSIVWSYELNPPSGLSEKEWNTAQQGFLHTVLSAVKEKVAK